MSLGQFFAQVTGWIKANSPEKVEPPSDEKIAEMMKKHGFDNGGA